jgi:RNA polymerase sigma-70 factor (family 1)
MLIKYHHQKKPTHPTKPLLRPNSFFLLILFLQQINQTRLDGNPLHIDIGIDQQLFLRISEGDENAFREIFNNYNRRLYPFILSLTKSEPDAREIVQEVFLKLWLSRDRLPEIENPGGWLHAMAANAAYDHLRKTARYELRLAGFENMQGDSNDEFWKEVEAKEAKELLKQAVSKLPLRRRLIFQLSKMEGFSRREIAEQLKISENTVRNQLAEAMEFVQEYLKGNGMVLIPLSILMIVQ